MIISNSFIIKISVPIAILYLTEFTLPENYCVKSPIVTVRYDKNLVQHSYDLLEEDEIINFNGNCLYFSTSSLNSHAKYYNKI
jgi:hypothetical protein